MAKFLLILILTVAVVVKKGATSESLNLLFNQNDNSPAVIESPSSPSQVNCSKTSSKHHRNETSKISCSEKMARFVTRERSHDDICRKLHNVSMCQEIEHSTYIDYLDVMYCKLPVMGVFRLWLAKTSIGLFTLLWIAFMFIIVGIVAEQFLCSSLEVVADTLHINQSIAGVTLLAFGTGSPDVFGSIAAATGASTEPTLAMGALLGSGLLATTVVTGCLFSLSSSPLNMARRPFVRDVMFYILVVGLITAVLWRGSISIVESICFLIVYALYAATVVFGRVAWLRLNDRQKRRDEKKSTVDSTTSSTATLAEKGLGTVNGDDDDDGEDERRIVKEITRPISRLKSLRRTHSNASMPSALPCTARANHTAARFTLSAFPGAAAAAAARKPLSNNAAAAASVFTLTTNVAASMLFMRSVSELQQQQEPVSALFTTSTKKRTDFLQVPARISTAAALNNTKPSSQVAVVVAKEQVRALVLSTTMPSSSSSSAAAAAIPWYIDIYEHIWPKIEWKTLPWYSRVIAFIKIPIQVVLFCLIPLVEEDQEDSGWCKWLNVWHLAIAPSFCTFLFTGTESTNRIVAIATVVAVSLVAALLLAVFTKRAGPVPRAYRLFSLLGFLVCIAIIYKIAQEIVGALSALGVLFNLSPTTLGLTLLSWGNSVPDLVASYALAQRGRARIAISSCYAAPIFGGTVGVGVAYTIVTSSINKGGGSVIRFVAPPIIKILAGYVLAVLVLLLVVVAFVYRFRPPRRCWFGYVLMVLFVLFIPVVVLSELKLF